MPACSVCWAKRSNLNIGTGIARAVIEAAYGKVGQFPISVAGRYQENPVANFKVGAFVRMNSPQVRKCNWISSQHIEREALLQLAVLAELRELKLWHMRFERFAE